MNNNNVAAGEAGSDAGNNVVDYHLLPLELHFGENRITRFLNIAVAAAITGYDADDIATRLRGEKESECPTKQMPADWRWSWRPCEISAGEKRSSSKNRGCELYDINTGKTMARFGIQDDAKRVTGSYSNQSSLPSGRLADACVYMWKWRNSGTGAAGAANGIHPNP